MRTLTYAAAAAAAVAAIAAAAPAHADGADQIATAICSTLDATPTFDTITGIGLALMSEGADSGQAAQIVVYSVIDYCPRHFPLVKAYGAQAQGVLA